ncbi:hypothetical protein ACU8C1_002858 [Escherichia coli]
MTELTKEQLIEEAKLKIAIAKCHTNSGMTRVEGELFKIALASLEAEPVASCIIEDGCMCVDGFGEYVGHSLPDGRHDLYAAPPALVLPHEWRLSNAQAFIERYSPPSVEEAALFAWNACRAAMLQGKGE